MAYCALASAADPLNGQGVVLLDLSGPDANGPSYRGTPHNGVESFPPGSGDTGTVGDWTAASGSITVGQPGPAVFSDFYGVGYNPGTLAPTAPDEAAEGTGAERGRGGTPAGYNSGDPGLMFANANTGWPVIADDAAQILQVPEPAAAVMLGTGLLALAGLRHRRPANARALHSGRDRWTLPRHARGACHGKR